MTHVAGRGAIAAGHPTTAQVGADILGAGGNAVDAAVAAILASFACEPLLTGIGAGGYMLVVAPDREPIVLDFFVAAAGRGADAAARAPLVPVEVSFGDAVQTFHVGAASVGVPGLPAGLEAAATRFGRISLAELAGPAVALARAGVPLTAMQAYLVEILAGIVTSTPECAALFAPDGRLLAEGDPLRQPELARALEWFAAEGAAPFYTGEVAAALSAWVTGHGGSLTPADLAAYRVVDRVPVRTDYRGREVLTNPPPSAGGTLIAHALERLDAAPGPPTAEGLVAAMEAAQALRTPQFLDRLAEAGSRLGSTTHISVVDHDGMACAATCSNGSSSGVVVPGTGIHLNNMLGEQDLNPLGFHRHPPGRRMPSMMSPTVVRRGGAVELVLGSAGSNRIRSAILQVISRVVDEGLDAAAAVEAGRLHVEDGVVFTEPGLAVGELERLTAAGRRLVPFRARNLFFGGAQAVRRDAGGRLTAAGDSRRGGAAIVLAADGG